MMAAWTNWRKVSDRKYWYGDDLDWNGPACYELAITGPRGGGLRIVYVGETRNEKMRLIAYASYGSHLSEVINWHLNQGWNLYYRAQLKKSKETAVRAQNRLLHKFEYGWNISLNDCRKR